MEVVEKKEMVHKDVYESGEKEYASKGVAGMVGLEAERRMCADNKIVNYANTTFYPIRVAAVEVGTDTVQRSLYNPLCPCAGYSNSILFEPTTTPAA